MPSYEVRTTDDDEHAFYWVRLSDKGKVTKRSETFTLFEAAVADANQQGPEDPTIDPEIL